MRTGTLYIVATPIGNLEDITVRAIKTLLSVDIIASEDTRRSGQLMQHIRTHYDNLLSGEMPSEDKFVRFDDQMERRVTPRLLAELQDGKSVAVISDSGTPLIADPGFSLVSAAIKHGITVVPIPGPNAAVTALSASGLPVHQFLFVGFLPDKKGKRINMLTDLLHTKKDLKTLAPTIIAYCAPHKLNATLTDIYAVFGNIDIAIARELTKAHEELWKGTIMYALKHFENPQGEFTLLF